MSRKNGNNNSVDLDIGTLSGHLWEAANILRGPVDAADFKTYIFPLLFFKRLSDVYDEEYAVALEESGGDVEFAQFPENHRFQVPEGCHWKDVRTKSANIGHLLHRGSIPLYVRGAYGTTSDEGRSVSLEQAITDWQSSLAELCESMTELFEILNTNPAGDTK